MTKIKPNANTIIKERPYSSASPNVGGTRFVRVTDELDVQDISPGLFNGHYEVTLGKKESWGGISYLYHEHFDLPRSDRLNPARLQIGEKGVNLIKSFEGCELNAYYCPAGVLTIG